MNEHPFGWWSLLPPVTALVLAVATRRVVFSLLAAVFAGAWVLQGSRLLQDARPWWSVERLWFSIEDALQFHLWGTLIDESKLQVFAFTLLMGAMVGVISRAGGMRGLVDIAQRWTRTRRGGQLLTWALGLVIFFDDYANTILLGNTLRPLCDRLKISRAKLAYLVDSTAAPVAGLALVSTWVAGEIEYVQDGIDKLPAAFAETRLSSKSETTALDLFFQSIPYRFYVLWALLFVPLVAWLGRDFGPMRKAELDAQKSDPPKDDTAILSNADEPSVADKSIPARWFNAVIPVGVTVGAITWLLYSSGRAKLPKESDVKLSEIFGNADAYSSLLWGALAGLVSAVVLILPQRILRPTQITEAAGKGARMVIPALVILWLASTLSVMTGKDPSLKDQHNEELRQAEAIGAARAQSEKPAAELAPELLKTGVSTGQTAELLFATGHPLAEVAAALQIAGAPRNQILRVLAPSKNADDLRREEVERALDEAGDEPSVNSPVSPAYPYQQYRLYTGEFLGELLKGRLPAWLFPTLVFLLSSGVAFATGTSWGTMGIIMPLAIPLAWQVISEGGSPTPEHPVLLCSIGSVLAGAIFGDHCSPISDTTVLSSQASGCDHLQHVWTQLPYALLVGGVAVVFGCLPIGLGIPVWVTLPVGAVVLVVSLRLLGKPVEV